MTLSVDKTIVSGGVSVLGSQPAHLVFSQKYLVVGKEAVHMEAVHWYGFRNVALLKVVERSLNL
jgi:hypothetical protein